MSAKPSPPGGVRKLNHVSLRVPPAAQSLIDTLRTALAHVLINRAGPDSTTRRAFLPTLLDS